MAKQKVIQMNVNADVTICICTYRRASLADTLQSISKQGCSIIVIDNDIAQSAYVLVEECRKKWQLEIAYIHAAHANISIARNAALSAVKTRWLAFIDDDEVAKDDWIAQLIGGREESVAVIGQSIAIYLDGSPSWASRLDFHSNRISVSERVDNAYTSNALIDVHFVNLNNIRFPEACGTTGGEDTLFFRAISEAGGRIVYRPESIVYEEVGPARANLSWVFRRKFRSGQTHSMMTLIYKQSSKIKLCFVACTKVVYCVIKAILSIGSFDRTIYWLARAVFHAGVINYCLSGSVFEEYSGRRVDTRLR